ncbi:c-type cytochrome [Aquimarina sp. 2201CG5-10]|uniref:c-type cytochrome n=1 Tax=Aquimarina callyspongiae TaxID=3098150 RepID=UPI002AB457F3|nr:c-type cytochrome [Aquimarina sp. 2201CG5-10]MDY8137129.1 cytochrome C552 [Aquimarina sp. 2201CG5-10]
MQKIHLLLIGFTILMVSCQSEKKEKEQISIGAKKEKVSPYDVGKNIFNGKGKCYTCHKIDKKSIGPGVVEIMNIYKEQKGDLIAFLKQDAKPIVDPETYVVMKTNFAILKTFSEEELKAIEIFMTDIANGKKK